MESVTVKRETYWYHTMVPVSSKQLIKIQKQPFPFSSIYANNKSMAIGEKLICNNKKAYHDYFIEEKLEAGLVLQGTEVKSLRAGKANLNDSFMLVRDGQAYLHNLNISPYDFGNRQNHQPDRNRKLLLHRKEIDRLYGSIREQGYSIIPLRLYFKNGLVKVEIGLGKGKKQYDKREDLKKKDSQRELSQVMKSRNRG